MKEVLQILLGLFSPTEMFETNWNKNLKGSYRGSTSRNALSPIRKIVIFEPETTYIHTYKKVFETNRNQTMGTDVGAIQTFKALVFC